MTLLDGIELRGRRAGSRVMFGPHETNLARHREISDRHVAYYQARAAGGAGIIVTEIASVHDSDHPYERAPRAAECLPGWQQVARACRPHGAMVLAGLGHAGAQGSSAFHQRELWGPSRVPDVVSRELPMEMEPEHIEAVVTGFGEAARLAVAAELDGVELNAGQHSLLRQFASGLTNLRDDAYGEDRLRFLREVIDTVRAELGDDRVLGVRLSADELAPWAGITPDQAAGYAARIAPLIDYLAVVRGSAMNVPATRPDLHTPPGFNTELCRGIRAAVDGTVPVVLQGSVVDPVAAEAALADGVADLVEMTRAQIAEPNLVTLARAGTPERIRPCTLSNQHSTVRDNRNPIVSDEANPSAGHETEDDDLDGADPVRHEVLVVGGGPAGLEAARVLAMRGHHVRLAERDGELGGALRWAAQVGGRARMGTLIGWWEAELRRLGVTVHTGTGIDAAALAAARDGGTAVVLATGSLPGPRDYEVAASAVVRPAAEFLREVAAAGSTGAALRQFAAGPVVVHDPIGDWTGVGVAEQLAAALRPVHLVTPDPVAGTQLSLTGDLAGANTRLAQAGVARELRTVLRAIGEDHVVLQDAVTGRQRRLACSLVVDCGHRVPDETLARQHPDLLRAGDCVAPRTVYEAVLEGRRAALRVAAGQALLQPA